MQRARNQAQIASDLRQITDALAEAQSERQRFRLLKSASPELVSILAARKPEESSAVARFREYQNFKLPLRGNDLEVPGGPHVAKALERTREALFTGEISQDEARSFARKMAMKYLDREQELPNPSPQGQ